MENERWCGMISGEEAKEAARTIYDYCNQHKNCNDCGLWNGKYCRVNYPSDDFIGDPDEENT